MRRVTDIDIAKGIGILMVMGLHCGFHQDWMTTFEMPLFFILSGLFFKADMPFRQCLTKKINTLLIPYIFFEAPKLAYDFWYFASHDVSIIECYTSSSVPTTTWFILCLFEIQIACYAIFKVSNAKVWLISVAAALFLAGYRLSAAHIYNFLFLCSAVTGSSFFLTGYLAKKLITKSPEPVISAASGGIMLAICYLIWNIDHPNVFYRGNRLDDYLPLVIAMAFCGSAGIISLSKSFNSRFVEFFGRNSLIILGTHLYVFLIFERLNANLHPMLLFLTGVILEIPIILTLRKFLPYLCGIKPLFGNYQSNPTHPIDRQSLNSSKELASR